MFHKVLSFLVCATVISGSGIFNSLACDPSSIVFSAGSAKTCRQCLVEYIRTGVLKSLAYDPSPIVFSTGSQICEQLDNYWELLESLSSGRSDEPGEAMGSARDRTISFVQRPPYEIL